MRRSVSILMLIQFCLLLFCSDLVLASALKQQNYTLAVLPLEAQDRVTDSEALALSKRLSGELTRFGIFEMMDTNQMESLLLTSDIDPSKCSNIQCAVQAGKILGTQLVANGLVRKVGPLYFIKVTITHVASGQTVQSVKDEYEGNFEDFLKHMSVVAQKLVGMNPGPAQAAPPQANRQNPGVTATQSEPSSNELPPIQDEAPTVRKSNKGKFILLGLLVAGGVGAGIYFSQKNKTNSTPQTSGVSTLPGHPSFP